MTIPEYKAKIPIEFRGLILFIGVRYLTKYDTTKLWLDCFNIKKRLLSKIWRIPLHSAKKP